MENAKEYYAELLSLAVHELRTPASVVGGYLRLLKSTEEPLSERQMKMVLEAEKSCARIVELVSQMSEVSTLDRGNAPFKMDTFALFPALADLADSVHEVSDREVRLRVQGEATGGTINGDAARLRSAFGTFFRTILREQPVSGTVVVERRLSQLPEGTSAVVVIAAENDVRSSYESPPAPLVEKRGGLGLALPIARRVIERHGGRVWSPLAPGASPKPGSGAIIVQLPLEESLP